MTIKELVGGKVVSELAGLTMAGRGVPPAQPSAEPQPDPSEKRVMGFLRISHTSVGMTLREISGGSSTPIADVRAALERLVAQGAVHHNDAPEQNYRRYRLASAPVQAPPAPAAEMSADDRWNLEQRRRVLREEAAKRTPEPIRYEPTPAEVEAELQKRKQVKPLTAEERELVKLGEGRVPRNPQVFVKR
jgi:hypothetical protein